MSKEVTVIAAVPFVLNGVAYQAGDPVSCRLVQAIVLGRRRHVRLTPQGRPLYPTRDMVATPPAAPTSSARAVVDDETPRPRRSRR